MRDAAYELIPFTQRRVLHAKLAEVLSSAASDPPVPANVVAYHWAQSCKLIDESGIDISRLPRVMQVKVVAGFYVIQRQRIAPMKLAFQSIIDSSFGNNSESELPRVKVWQRDQEKKS